jgi:hypothetical protein
VFHGGVGSVRGHRGMLCAGSEEYCGMFRSGMVEEQEGKVAVPPCVGVESFRGFLEWVYLGECCFVCHVVLCVEPLVVCLFQMMMGGVKSVCLSV